VGRVAAGNPVLAQQHIEDYCDLAPSFFKPQADYFLTVQGDSMIEIGIFDEDLLAVHRTQDVRDGDIVVARIDNEVTVKRLKRGKNPQFLELLPENQEYEPIKVDLANQEFAIEGISVGVLRRS
jgi:repressor LexA